MVTVWLHRYLVSCTILRTTYFQMYEYRWDVDSAGQTLDPSITLGLQAAELSAAAMAAGVQGKPESVESFVSLCKSLASSMPSACVATTGYQEARKGHVTRCRTGTEETESGLRVRW